MEGYIEGHDSYIEKGNIPSCALGWCVIYFNMRNIGNHDIMEINAQAFTE